MAGDDDHSFDDKPGFDDLLADMGEASDFDWEEEEVEDDDEQTRPVVSFRLGGDYFAVPGDAVREIVGSVDVTPLPGAPPHIDGITVVHRQIVGLLSLHRFLDVLPTTEEVDSGASGDDDTGLPGDADTRRTLIVDTAHYTVGLRVDEVTGLDEWPESLLDATTIPQNMRDTTRRYARGARRLDDGLCVYLDVESLLDDAAVQ